MNLGFTLLRNQVVELKKFTLQKCNPTMVNIGCQLDRIWNRLGAKPPGKPNKPENDGTQESNDSSAQFIFINKININIILIFHIEKHSIMY